MNRLLVCVSVFVFSIFVIANAEIEKRCLDCICQQESGCKKTPCAMDGGSLSCGFFQIKLPYYIDCGKVGKKPSESTEDAWKRCSNDYDCARECVNKYMNRYASSCQSNPTCEVYARVHNGGPRGCRSSSTIGYWNAIKKCLN